jgi:N-acetylmuramoyl-L-alanine amidase
MSIEIHDAHLDFKGTLKVRGVTTQIVVHHSAGNPLLTVQQIHAEHQAKGWAGIGYHDYIDHNGIIWLGRPENMIGAHAYQDATHEANSNGIGICVAGDFTSIQPNALQMASLVSLIKDKKTRYPNAAVRKHSDVMATQCPGLSFPWAALIAALNGTSDNAAYFSALAELVRDKVISSPDYWQNCVVNNSPVRGDWMAIAILKMTNKGDLQSALNVLVAVGAISSPDYWLANCAAGKTVAASYVKVLIVNAVTKLKL